MARTRGDQGSAGSWTPRRRPQGGSRHLCWILPTECKYLQGLQHGGHRSLWQDRFWRREKKWRWQCFHSWVMGINFPLCLNFLYFKKDLCDKLVSNKIKTKE